MLAIDKETTPDRVLKILAVHTKGGSDLCQSLKEIIHTDFLVDGHFLFLLLFSFELFKCFLAE